MYTERGRDVCNPEVDAVWIASPNALHAEHTIMAARAGKHVICEKPMAVSLQECAAMVEAVERHGVIYVQGHSKAYDHRNSQDGRDPGFRRARRVIHVQTWNWNDWLLRALVASEVDTEQGWGWCSVRGRTRSISCATSSATRCAAACHHGPLGSCLAKRRGQLTAFLEFESGVVATMMFDGYGYFDVAELTWGIGEIWLPHENPEVTDVSRASGPNQRGAQVQMVRQGNWYGYSEGGGVDTSSSGGTPSLD